MLKFLVKQQKIEILEREVIASDQISFVTLKFTFDGDWKKFYKVVQFTQCDETYNRALGFDGLSCLLPTELHAGAVKMSVFGYDTDNTSGLRATTVPVTLNIRQSGFVGDDDVPIPPTPDLYTQILQKIEEVTVPDMSEYLKKDEIQKMIAQALENSGTVIPSDYVTIEKLNDEILMVHEAISPIRSASHSHQNKELLDSLDTDSLALLSDLQQFEDTVKEDIHRIDEIVQSINNAAHTHENLDVLDGITADRAASWDSMKTSINSFMNSMTVYNEKVSNTAARVGSAESEITALQKTIEALQKQIDSVSESSAVILFQNGTDALEKYGDTIYTFYNNGYRSLDGFAQAYPNFCSAENDYALYYNQSDFSWAGTVYTMILKPFSISKNASIVITYQSGASATGELYLMRKISGRTYAELAQVVYEQIQKGNVIKLDFQWLQSADFISVLTECTDADVGDYYLAWKGVSDNTHPKIKTIKVLGG